MPFLDVLINLVRKFAYVLSNQISKMLNQISVGKLFDADNIYLQPLNEYVGYASVRFFKYFKSGKSLVFFLCAIPYKIVGNNFLLWL